MNLSSTKNRIVVLACFIAPTLVGLTATASNGAELDYLMSNYYLTKKGAAEAVTVGIDTYIKAVSFDIDGKMWLELENAQKVLLEVPSASPADKVQLVDKIYRASKVFCNQMRKSSLGWTCNLAKIYPPTY